MITNERDRFTRKGSGSHNRTTVQNSKLGRKGGKAKVPKGFAKMESEKLKEVTSKGGKSRQDQRRKLVEQSENVLRGHTTDSQVAEEA